MSVAPMSISALLGRMRRPRIRETRPRRDLSWLWVTLLTVVAGALRYTSLGHEKIWVDEAAVFWRTCGTYEQLLTILRNDGFAPLHYEFYWALKHFVTLTPSVLRFLPATAAVLMVPAMYFLARQLVSRNTALAVAAFTAVSGHLGWHAHDAKMYSHLWLSCTLSMGCLLWWMQNRSGVAWWCWVVTSIAAVGLHSLGWGVLALQPLFFLAKRPTWRTVLAFALGFCLIGAGPAFYYLSFNRWTQNIREQGWNASGIAWIEQYTPKLASGRLVEQTGVHLFFGYDFPPPLPQSLSKWAPTLAQETPDVLLWILLLGTFPYPTRSRAREAGRRPQAAWRAYLYLSAWVLLPAYAFYCASFAEPTWPHQMLASAGAAIFSSTRSAALGIAVASLALYFCASTWSERWKRLAQFATVSVIVLAIATLIAVALRTRPPGPLWVSRYISIIWPATVIGVCALIMRLPFAVLRWTIVGLLLTLNLGMSLARIQLDQNPPIDRVAADILDAQRPDGARLHFLSPELRPAMLALEGRYYLFALSQRPTWPNDMAGGDAAWQFGIPGLSTRQQVAEKLRSDPGAKRLVVWDKLPAAGTPSNPMLWKEEPPADTLVGMLPGTWQRTRVDRYVYFNRWGWWAQGIWRRREYTAQ